MQLLRRLSFTMLLMSMMTLVACGDGDGDLTGGDDGGGETPDTVVFTVTKSDGDLSAANDITITASVVDNGAAVANKIVTFTVTNPTIATLNPEVGTAVTDASGNASVVAKVTDVAGGVEVTASITGSDDVSIGFTSIGDGQGIPPEGSPEAASISLFASSQQLASSGAQSIELIAIAKDANNNLVEGVLINFSADTGSLEKVVDGEGDSQDTTGPDGKISMMLTTQSEPANRIIATTITSGDVTDTLEVQVVGTSVSLEGTSSLAINDAASYIIKLLDSDGNGIANATVALSLTGESTETPAGSVATITLPSEVTTDFNGQATVSVSGTTGGTNSIVASGLGATATKAVSVQSDSFLFTSFSNGVDTVNPSSALVPDVLLSQTGTLTLSWLRAGIPVADGRKVNFTTTRGTLSAISGTTVDGKVTTTFDSTNAGNALVTFTGIDTVDGKAIELNNQLEIEFVADTADRIVAQAFPQTIAPNEQTSTISVIVKDPTGNLVKNKTVDFVLTDTNGGSIFPASAVTDSNGSATTVYTSNGTSAKDGVAIQATVRDAPTISDEVLITVAEREAFITLGTGNSIRVGEDETTYVKKYSVFVTDINSRPIKDVTLTVSAIPVQYIKGYWEAILKDGEFDHYATKITAVCENEDKNQDSFLDAGEDDDPVNGNNDGELTPGNLVSIFGTGDNAEVITDEHGRAVLDLAYPESFGGWATVEIVVSAKVGGTESFARGTHLLYVASTDVTIEGNPPGGNIHGISDFGMSSNCTNPN